MKLKIITALFILLLAGCSDGTEDGYICPYCGRYNAKYLLKADPVTMERKIGSVAKVNYRLYCIHCDKEVEVVWPPLVE